MTRCRLLRTINRPDPIAQDTHRIVLETVPDGRLRIKFNGWNYCHLVPARFVDIVDESIEYLKYAVSPVIDTLPDMPRFDTADNDIHTSLSG